MSNKWVTHDFTVMPLVIICYTSALKKMKSQVNMKSMIKKKCLTLRIQQNTCILL